MNKVSTQSQAAFESLFHYAQQLTPYLDGRVGVAQAGKRRLRWNVTMATRLPPFMTKSKPRLLKLGKLIGSLAPGGCCAGNRCTCHFSPFTHKKRCRILPA